MPRNTKPKDDAIDFSEFRKHDFWILIWILRIFVGVASVGLFFLRFFVWFTCLVRRRIVLVAYADYPPWRDYIETHVLPRARGRAIIIRNWSFKKRRRYPFVDRIAFMVAAGSDSVPIIIRFRPFSAPQCYHLRQALWHHKRGCSADLERLVAEAFDHAA